MLRINRDKNLLLFSDADFSLHWKQLLNILRERYRWPLIFQVLLDEKESHIKKSMAQIDFISRQRRHSGHSAEYAGSNNDMKYFRLSYDFITIIVNIGIYCL